MKLYWVTTEDHDEDWFVVAQNAKKATRFFEDYEGYNRGDAAAQEVLSIPSEIATEPGWPDEDLLLAVGARYLHSDQTRVVEINGRTYCEGMLEATLNELTDDVFEQLGQERPNQTRKSTPQ